MASPSTKKVDEPTSRTGPEKTQQTYTYYHAGPLFTLSDLPTNLLLSHSISRLSHGKFRPLLPQDLEQRGAVTPQKIYPRQRPSSPARLRFSTLHLRRYRTRFRHGGGIHGGEMRRFPSVILRSDFRGGGGIRARGIIIFIIILWGELGSRGISWRVSGRGRKGVVVDGMEGYKSALACAGEEGDVDDLRRCAGEGMVDGVAGRCVAAMEEVLAMPACMPREVRRGVYRWLARMPGYAELQDEQDEDVMVKLLEAKERKGLFQS